MLHDLDRGITNLYRDVLYTYLQRFVYHGQMFFFGSIVNPVGCAVAYRREYLKELFDYYEPRFGDNLTNSEDIFIGFAFVDYGYRNAQLMDVCARSLEPEVQHLPRQLYLWSSSFLQSCYYFDELLRSPFKALKRAFHRTRERARVTHNRIRDLRKAREPYRQAFGLDKTRTYGRPMGWVMLTSAMETVFFPTTLVVMLILQMWEPLAVTLAAETVVSVGLLTAVSEGRYPQRRRLRILRDRRESEARRRHGAVPASPARDPCALPARGIAGYHARAQRRSGRPLQLDGVRRGAEQRLL